MYVDSTGQFAIEGILVAMRPYGWAALAKIVVATVLISASIPNTGSINGDALINDIEETFIDVTVLL